MTNKATTELKQESQYGYLLSTVLIIVSVILANYTSLYNGFALDDEIHITSNLSIRTQHSILHLFAEPIFPGNLYRPLVQASYALTYRFVELEPFLYHFTNLVFHIGNSLLVYFLLNVLFGLQIGLYAALLFSVLPIHTEAIANISGRYELFSAFFGLLALFLLIRWKNKITFFYLMNVTIIFLMALLSKESALVIIPLFILCYWYKNLKLNGEFYKRLASLISAVFIYFTIRFMALGSDLVSFQQHSELDNYLINLNWIERAVNAIYLQGYYIFLNIFPYQLSADYSWQVIKPFPVEFSNTNFLLTLVFVVLTGTAIFYSIKRAKLSFGLCWFLIAFLITSNVFFPIGTIFGERLSYLPSVGVAAMLAFLINILKPQFRTILIVVILSGYTIISALRSGAWYDNNRLHAEQIFLSPESAKTRFNYAMVLRNKGLYEPSKIQLQKALSLYGDYDDAKWGLGLLSGDSDNYEEAEKYFKEVLQHNPEHKRTLISYARMCLKQNRGDFAGNLINKAVNLWGDDYEIQLTKLGLLILNKQNDEAKKLFLYLKQLDPQHKELSNLETQAKELGVL